MSKKDILIVIQNLYRSMSAIGIFSGLFIYNEDFFIVKINKLTDGWEFQTSVNSNIFRYKSIEITYSSIQKDAKDKEYDIGNIILFFDYLSKFDLIYINKKRMNDLKKIITMMYNSDDAPYEITPISSKFNGKEILGVLQIKSLTVDYMDSRLYNFNTKTVICNRVGDHVINFHLILNFRKLRKSHTFNKIAEHGFIGVFYKLSQSDNLLRDIVDYLFGIKLISTKYYEAITEENNPIRISNRKSSEKMEKLDKYMIDDLVICISEAKVNNVLIFRYKKESANEEKQRAKAQDKGI